MIDKLIGLVAFATLAGFMGIIVWFVPEPDLAIVVFVVLAFAGYDFYSSTIRGRDDR